MIQFKYEPVWLKILVNKPFMFFCCFFFVFSPFNVYRDRIYKKKKKCLVTFKKGHVRLNMHARTRWDAARFPVDELWPKFVSSLLWTKRFGFFWPILSLIRRPAPVTSSPMLIQLFLHRLTCCSLITLTQRWQSGDLLAATTQIGSRLVREQSAVTFNLLWVCVAIWLDQQKTLSYQHLVYPNWRDIQPLTLFDQTSGRVQSGNLC